MYLIPVVILAMVPVSTATSCEALSVKVQALEPQIPWFPKEHYVDKNSAQPAAIECFIRDLGGFDVGHDDLSVSSGPEATWLWYKEYVNLDSLQKEEEMRPCRIVETREAMEDLENNANDTLDNDEQMEEEVIKRCPVSMQTSVESTSNSDHLSSTLTLLQPKEWLSGTYRCLFTWGSLNTTCISSSGEEMILDELSAKRGATLYVKIYEKQSYKSDLMHVALAILLLLIILFVVAILDHLANAKAVKPAFYSPAI